eukprot:COSAG05_NODE_1717_length_4225_cov_67.463160_2_plen_309_part_00
MNYGGYSGRAYHPEPTQGYQSDYSQTNTSIGGFGGNVRGAGRGGYVSDGSSIARRRRPPERRRQASITLPVAGNQFKAAALRHTVPSFPLADYSFSTRHDSGSGGGSGPVDSQSQMLSVSQTSSSQLSSSEDTDQLQSQIHNLTCALAEMKQQFASSGMDSVAGHLAAMRQNAAANASELRRLKASIEQVQRDQTSATQDIKNLQGSIASTTQTLSSVQSVTTELSKKRSRDDAMFDSQVSASDASTKTVVHGGGGRSRRASTGRTTRQRTAGHGRKRTEIVILNASGSMYDVFEPKELLNRTVEIFW